MPDWWPFHAKAQFNLLKCSSGHSMVLFNEVTWIFSSEADILRELEPESNFQICLLLSLKAATALNDVTSYFASTGSCLCLQRRQRKKNYYSICLLIDCTMARQSRSWATGFVRWKFSECLQSLPSISDAVTLSTSDSSSTEINGDAIFYRWF